MKKTIIINAGHWDDPNTPHIEDSGARHNHIMEQIECAIIRNMLLPILKERGYKVYAVPDHLDLKKSIEWANKKAPKLDDAFAIDIHLNYLSNKKVGGTETFHGTSRHSKRIASFLAEEISKSLGVKNRGAKPDTQTFHGSLAWIRKTTMYASLVEICFMSNESDMRKLKAPGGYRKACEGIANGIDRIYGNKYQKPAECPSLCEATKDQVIRRLLQIIRK